MVLVQTHHKCPCLVLSVMHCWAIASAASWIFWSAAAATGFAGKSSEAFWIRSSMLFGSEAQAASSSWSQFSSWVTCQPIISGLGTTVYLLMYMLPVHQADLESASMRCPALLRVCGSQSKDRKKIAGCQSSQAGHGRSFLFIFKNLTNNYNAIKYEPTWKHGDT